MEVSHNFPLEKCLVGIEVSYHFSTKSRTSSQKRPLWTCQLWDIQFKAFRIQTKIDQRKTWLWWNFWMFFFWQPKFVYSIVTPSKKHINKSKQSKLLTAAISNGLTVGWPTMVLCWLHLWGREAQNLRNSKGSKVPTSFSWLRFGMLPGYSKFIWKKKQLQHKDGLPSGRFVLFFVFVFFL